MDPGSIAPLGVRAGPFFAVGLAGALGLIHGPMNGVEMGEAGLGLTGLLGVLVVLFVVVSLVSAFVVSLQRDWMRIAVRIAGSWIVAVGSRSS